jgi:predicted dehydrogenase
VSAPDIGVGMLGYAFMGKAHANAYRTLSYMTWPPPLVPRLVRIAGRNPEAVAEAARRYGFDDHATDWRERLPARLRSRRTRPGLSARAGHGGGPSVLGPLVEPHGASFRDGYRAAEVADGVVRSAEEGARVELSYREG